MEYCDKRETRSLKVETSSAIYEVVFGQIQIEITGKCNMFCQHCRAADEKGIDMPVKQIVKVLKFARKYSPSHKELVISGGEPLLHNDFFNLFKLFEKRKPGFFRFFCLARSGDERVKIFYLCRDRQKIFLGQL